MQHLADLSDPMVDRDFGASQTERGLATHRDEVLPLATRLTVILDRAHLVGIAAVEHLVDETVIVAGIVARVDVFEAIPVIDKDLFEDVGVLRRCCHHQVAPSKGIGLLGIERFYHVSRSASTPSSVFTGTPSHPLSHPGATRTSEQLKNGNSYTIKQQDRTEAQASLRRALTLGGRDVGAMHVHHDLISHEAYHVPSGTHCNPDVSGNCSGMGI